MAEDSRYIEAVGRRKTATARVRITRSSDASIVVNGREFFTYFPTEDLRRNVSEVLTSEKIGAHFRITVVVKGGGTVAQSIAIRHGIARALLGYNLELRPELKQAGFLKRDPRMKERRKFGLKKARKAPQWAKR